MSSEFLTECQFHQELASGRFDFSDARISGRIVLSLSCDHPTLRLDRANLESLAIVGWNNPVATLSAEGVCAGAIRLKSLGIHQLNLHGASTTRALRVSNSRIKRVVLSKACFKGGFALYKTTGEFLDIEASEAPWRQYDELSFRDIYTDDAPAGRLAS